MKLYDKEIEKRAQKIIRFRKKLFILKFIGESEHSVSQECKEFGLTKV